MFIPYAILIPMALLAILAILAIGTLFHVAMSDMGLRFFGRRDVYLRNNVLEERWCVLYIPVHRRIGCHSLASV